MNNQDLLEKFGNHIRELRIKKGLSTSALANLCSTKEEYITEMENGNIDCQIDFLIVLAKALSIKVNHLFDY